MGMKTTIDIVAEDLGDIVWGTQLICHNVSEDSPNTVVVLHDYYADLNLDEEDSEYVNENKDIVIQTKNIPKLIKALQAMEILAS